MVAINFLANVRPVSDAIVSAMQWCPLRTLLHIIVCNRGLCRKPSGGRTCVYIMGVRNQRSCTVPDIINYSRIIFMINSANTQRPNISHVIHDKHLACTKFRPVDPMAFNLLQGWFCTGRTQLHIMQMCPAGLHYAAASGRTRLHM